MNKSASDKPAGTRAGIRDMLGGALLIAVGAAVFIAAQGYGVGTLTEMGAGYFPSLIGAVMFGLGVLMLAPEVIKHLRLREPPQPFSTGAMVRAIDRRQLMARLRGMLCIVGGLVAFIVLGEYGGLLPASFAAVFISALGDRDNSWRSAFLIALAMTTISVIVFWWALQLQMPLLRFIG